MSVFRGSLLAAALTSLFVLGVGAALVLDALGRPHAAWAGSRVEVTFEPGLSAHAMLERLGRAGVLDRPRLALAWLKLCGGAHRLRAGEYRFDRPASTREVLDRLLAGDVLLHEVTIPEGLELRQTAERFVAAELGELDELLSAFGRAELVRDVDPEAEDLEGYLFPDTYRFARSTEPGRIAQTMVARFRAVALPEIREKAAELGLDLRDAVTLASLIEKETSVSAERARISRVFHNRLERGMKLQCDPTVRYALTRAGQSVTRLTYADLEFDSPWNTYRYHGLPPGPIASPGAASLRAAVEPDDGAVLYFVAAPEGGHRFSADLAGHLRAVAEWRRHSRSSR